MGIINSIIEEGDIVQPVTGDVIGGLEVVKIVGAVALCIGFRIDTNPFNTERFKFMDRQRSAYPLNQLTLVNKCA